MSSEMKPLPLRQSVLLFAVPSAVITLAVYVGMPWLNRIGVPMIWNFAITLTGPLALMLAAALAAYRLEGNPLSWAAFKERFRLRPMNRQAWLWTVGLFLFMGLSTAALGFTGRWLAKFPLFAPPPFLPPSVDPRVPQSAALTDFMGVPLRRHWWVAFLFLGILFFNIFGEEFWWRGYILPRQEVVHGEWTWLIHGLLWDLFHIFWKWNLIALLPVTLSVAFVAQKLKNTWPGIIVHFALNGLGIIPIVLGILGHGA